MKIPAANQVWASHYVVLCPQFLSLFGPGKCPRPQDAIEDSSRVSLFFELMIYLNNFESCVNCVWCTLWTVSDADWPRLEIAFLMHSCLRVSWFIKPNRFAGHLRKGGRASGMLCRLEPQKGSRKPRGSCKQTHTHTHALKSSCCHALSTTIWSFVYIEHILFFLFVALLLIGIWFQPATVTSVLCSN